jgi:uncharacterized protein YcbK (DUF882 family)
MGDLSPHFSSIEFRDQVTGELVVSPKLIYGLEQLRALVHKPVLITSGYRSPAHNREVGGVQHSYHTTGEAADIRVEGLTVFELYILADQVEEFENGGIGIYDGGFVHVDVRDARARWGRVAGNYVSIAEFIGMTKAA